MISQTFNNFNAFLWHYLTGLEVIFGENFQFSNNKLVLTNLKVKFNVKKIRDG
jgi:hypothetical protein